MSGFDSVIELSNFDGTDGFQIDGEYVLGRSGRSVASAGDVNGDGFDDLIIGAPSAAANGTYSGATYVVFGKAGGFTGTLALSSLDGNTGFQLSGIADYRSGISVASAGDVNGDGIDDIIIGAYAAQPNGFNSGATYVVFGTDQGFAPNINVADLTGGNGFKINGEAPFDYSGFSVASAGDVNGDGIDDLIIGANSANPTFENSGASYVVFGSTGGFAASLNLAELNDTNGFQINGVVANDYSGVSVSSAGDVNGDGYDDLIIGASWADPNGTSSGASYVVFGAAGAFEGELNLSSLTGANGFRIGGEAEGDRSGRSVASAGDVNGDGFADLIIGAFRAGPNGTFSGASYVVFGAASGFTANLNLSSLTGSNGFQISGELQGDYSGFSVASAGDVNGDGFDDLIIGAENADPNGYSSGASYVVFGAAGGFLDNLNLADLNGTNGFKISGESPYDRFGTSVASAGDINGDGFDDLIVGAFGSYAGGDRVGASYVIFGRAPTTAVTRTGTELNNQIRGGAQNDALNGLGGHDRLFGEGGDDTLDGGAGNDTLYGGAGNDVFVLSGVGDEIVDESGVDEVQAAGSLNLTSDIFDGIESAALLGTDDADLTGDDSANVLTGNAGRNAVAGGSGDDTVYGGVGDDTLDGGAGNDTLYGGAGNDVFVLDGAGDAVGDDSGIDEVRASFALDLSAAGFAAIENAALLGAASVNLTGDEAANTLTGNGGRNVILGGAGNDRLLGEGGNDTLDGGTGNDLLYGGAGDDVFVLDAAGDRVFDTSGTDEVRAGFALNLASSAFAGIEDAALLGAGHMSLTGDEAANVLTGNGGRNLVVGGAGNDRLLGEGGNDTLDGGTGNDLLYGGAGDDVFVLDVAGDRVFDTAGTDEVRAGFALNLASSAFAGIENAALLGAGHMSLTGDEAANTLTGNGGRNVILGGAGNDRLLGEGGNDTLDGGTGNDIMYGGAGDDVFILDAAGDRVFDTSGTDEVRAGFALNLASSAFAGIEDAALLGAGHMSLTGDEAANTLTGNGGSNVILGGAGNDTLSGGAGNDTVAGGAGRDVMAGGLGNDVFEFALTADLTTSANSTDLVTDFRRGQDKIDLSDIDASTALAGNGAFVFAGTAAHGTAAGGEIYVRQFDAAGTANDHTLIYLDTDADTASEAVIRLTGLHGLTVGDFIL